MPANACQFERLGYFCVDPDSSSRKSGFQPHRSAERHLGENRKTRDGQLNILGIGGVLGDAAAAVIKDGEIAAAMEEAKLTRRPQPGRLPDAAIATCLSIAGIGASRCGLCGAGSPLAAGLGAADRAARFPKARIVTIDHHAAHAAAAYLPSPFDNAAVITLDREGDLRCGGKWRGEGNRLTLEEEILYPDSIGELYGRVTALLGFQPRADEHRVQWLSATGEPRYVDVFAQNRFGSYDRSFLLRIGPRKPWRVQRGVFRTDRHRWPRRR